MSKVIILKGLPASGKSTWAKEYIKEHPNTKRINKDLLREMLDFSEYSKENEKMILQIRDTLILKFLDEGYDVIVDDTNLSPKHERRIKSIVPKNTDIIINDSFLKVPLDTCINRDVFRDNPVGEKVIRDMYNKYLVSIGKIPLNASSPHLYKYKNGLPDCIICDIDGTLALHNDRKPYEYEKCDTDNLNYPIANLIRMFYDNNYIIILVSGREDYIKDKTKTWLNNKQIPYHYLYMRKSGDYRKDYIIKKEIYDKNIRNLYNVFMVIDDRPQVIQMWKKEGLCVFDVGWGVEF